MPTYPGIILDQDFERFAHFFPQKISQEKLAQWQKKSHHSMDYGKKYSVAKSLNGLRFWP